MTQRRGSVSKKGSQPDPEDVEKFIFSLYVNTNTTPTPKRRSTIHIPSNESLLGQSNQGCFMKKLGQPKKPKLARKTSVQKLLQKTFSRMETKIVKSARAFRGSISM